MNSFLGRTGCEHIYFSRRWNLAYLPFSSGRASTPRCVIKFFALFSHRKKQFILRVWAGPVLALMKIEKLKGLFSVTSGPVCILQAVVRSRRIRWRTMLSRYRGVIHRLKCRDSRVYEVCQKRLVRRGVLGKTRWKRSQLTRARRPQRSTIPSTWMQSCLLLDTV